MLYEERAADASALHLSAPILLPRHSSLPATPDSIRCSSSVLCPTSIPYPLIPIPLVWLLQYQETSASQIAGLRSEILNEPRVPQVVFHPSRSRDGTSRLRSLGFACACLPLLGRTFLRVRRPRHGWCGRWARRAWRSPVLLCRLCRHGELVQPQRTPAMAHRPPRAI